MNLDIVDYLYIILLIVGLERQGRHMTSGIKHKNKVQVLYSLVIVIVFILLGVGQHLYRNFRQ